MNEGDKDVDIMQRALETVIEHLEMLHENQNLTVENINKIL